MNTNRIAILATLAATLLANVATASTLNLIAPNTSRGTYLTMNYNGSDVSGFAGAIATSIDGSAILYDMFCVDITTHSFLNNPYEAVGLPPATAINNGGRAAWLFDTFNSAAQTVTTGAALQLALWDVIEDNGDGFATGLFRSTASIPNDILVQAAAYITASAGHTSTNATVWQSVLGKGDRQEMMGQVPEPSTIGLLASGLALIGWKARRKQA
jgi:hypothetical protein